MRRSRVRSPSAPPIQSAAYGRCSVFSGILFVSSLIIVHGKPQAPVEQSKLLALLLKEAINYRHDPASRTRPKVWHHCPVAAVLLSSMVRTSLGFPDRPLDPSLSDR